VLVALDEAQEPGRLGERFAARPAKIENLKLTTATPNTSQQIKQMCPDEEPKTAA
jgi:hypothetical protein